MKNERKVVTVDMVGDQITRCLTEYTKSRLAALDKLTLDKLLGTKNLYLFASRVSNSSDLITEMVRAQNSSSEESRFGKVFQEIAEAVIKFAHQGLPLPISGIDSYLAIEDYIFLLSQKSGSRWCNQDQRNSQRADFEEMRKRFKRLTSAAKIVTTMIISYGPNTITNCLDHCDIQLEGKAAWQFLTANPEFYLDLIDLVQADARAFEEKLLAKQIEVVAELNTKFGYTYASPTPNKAIGEGVEVNWRQLVADEYGGKCNWIVCATKGTHKNRRAAYPLTEDLQKILRYPEMP